MARRNPGGPRVSQVLVASDRSGDGPLGQSPRRITEAGHAYRPTYRPSTNAGRPGPAHDDDTGPGRVGCAASVLNRRWGSGLHGCDPHAALDSIVTANTAGQDERRLWRPDRAATPENGDQG